jgi:hypothetical protein
MQPKFLDLLTGSSRFICSRRNYVSGYYTQDKCPRACSRNHRPRGTLPRHRASGDRTRISQSGNHPPKKQPSEASQGETEPEDADGYSLSVSQIRSDINHLTCTEWDGYPVPDLCAGFLPI